MTSNTSESPDLVGGPFAVIESDPGVFTSLVRRLGIRGLEVIELYGIEPWAMDHLRPYGLIFCFMWRKDTHRPADFNDPAAEKVWFANQLSDDSCATHAILNVLLNTPGIELGPELEEFKRETELMSPVMRGLAVTNLASLRREHNALARPADVRGALNALATTTLEGEKEKKKLKAESHKPPPGKRARRDPSPRKKTKRMAKPQDGEEVYHFIGYVPAHGKVWELDGFKSGPLEVGEVPAGPCSSLEGNEPKDWRQTWIDVVRPALRMKMEKYGGSGDDESDIRFNLLAVVDDNYLKAHDEYLFLDRERTSIEKLLNEGWKQQVDRELLSSINREPPLSPQGQAQRPRAPFSQDFAARRMERDIELQRMSQRELLLAWEDSARQLRGATITLQDEIAKGRSANTDHIKRTFDYEPFLVQYITRLHHEGLLAPLLGLGENGKKEKAGGSTGKKG